MPLQVSVWEVPMIVRMVVPAMDSDCLVASAVISDARIKEVHILAHCPLPSLPDMADWLGI